MLIQTCGKIRHVEPATGIEPVHACFAGTGLNTKLPHRGALRRTKPHQFVGLFVGLFEGRA